MENEEVVLRFDLKDGQNADAIVAAEALIAWVRLVQETAKALDSECTVELLGVPEGSLAFRQLLKKADDAIKSVNVGADEFPELKKAGLTLAAMALAAGMGAEATTLLGPRVQKVEVVSDHSAALARIAASPGVQAASQNFFSTVQRDPAVARVVVAEDAKGEAISSVPAEQFAERSGLWNGGSEEEETPAEKIINARWTVVLVKPAVVGQPRAWRFSRDGVEFSAVMADRDYLDAIREGRLPINLQEGVVMNVAVRYKERLTGQVWQFVAGTRRITKVLSPLPRPGSSPSLPFPHGPEEKH